jgi:hypothetical protein
MPNVPCPRRCAAGVADNSSAIALRRHHPRILSTNQSDLTSPASARVRRLDCRGERLLLRVKLECDPPEANDRRIKPAMLPGRDRSPTVPETFRTVDGRRVDRRAGEPPVDSGSPVRSPHGSDTNFRVAQTRLRTFGRWAMRLTSSASRRRRRGSTGASPDGSR